MIKRTAGILLCSALFAASLFGCGDNGAAEAVNNDIEVEETEEEPEEDESEPEETAAQSDGTGEAAEEKAAEETVKIGVLLPEGTSEEGIRDSEALKRELEDSGYEAVFAYADGETEDQTAQMQELSEESAALIIEPEDPYAWTDALIKLKENKSVPVISYDELIMESDKVSYYVTFDKRKTGRLLGQTIADKLDLEKAREEKQTCTIEFFMGSPDDMGSLFLYNGMMEVLQEYLNDGTLMCRSGRISFDDTGLLRFSRSLAVSTCREILQEYYPDDCPDVLCTAFDQAACGVAEVLQERGAVPAGEDWPLIAGVGCEAESVKAIAEGRQSFSILMDRAVLASDCADLVAACLNGEEPDINDHEQYDNGIKIINAHTCEGKVIDGDNYELLIDSGYYSEEELDIELPEPTEGAELSVTPEPTGEAEISAAPEPAEGAEVSVTPEPDATDTPSAESALKA